MKFLARLLFAATCLCGAAFAADAPLDVATRYGHYHADYVVNPDGSSVETHEWAQTVLKQSALDDAKRASVGYSTSTQSAEVLAAYTVKADGRRIEVPKDNYQLEVNSGKGGDSPVYSDRTTLTVVFPEVAVGDSVLLSYRLTTREPMFAGHFSAAQLFYKSAAHDAVRVSIDYPATMAVQYEGRGMRQVESATADRRRVEWSYANPQPVKSERRDYSVFDPDREAGYAFTTFRDYAEIAAAYGARALPKAAVTERIKTLAGEIVQGKPNRKEEARALYEWVATRITYAGNCIGVGAVVPRDLNFVLDNRMGDCKDHATLLQALLAARGIASTQALVNAGAGYRLQKIPSVFGVNHVINYLPEFDLFVDSTSDSTPFGLLPFNDQDKPVLLVDGFRPGLKTPVAPASANRQTTRSQLKLAADGSVSGRVEIEQRGADAVSSRAWARNLSRDVETDLVKNAFRDRGLIGSGKFEKDDPTALTDRYRYQASFQAEKFFKTPGAGAYYIFPPLGFGSAMFGVVSSSLEPGAEVDVACAGGTLVEDYTIELPKNVKVLALPADLKLDTKLLAYTARYRRQGNVLTVHRTLDDRTRGNVCSPQVVAEYRKVAEKVLDNLKEPVLYK